MEKNKLITLVEKLSSRSIKGELDWEQTDKEGIFQLTLAKYTIRISAHTSEEDPTSLDIFLTIYNEEGTLIERTVDYDLKNDIQNSYQVFKEIYNNARRKAMGVDKALDDILTSLGDDDDSPF
ncbi:MAG: hypothetical protein IPM56_02420 [Ignavibacteriales bacterium]|nr:MAG: hypothetical protein IPM56_02420 [Ignavibacteriales bacterium]